MYYVISPVPVDSSYIRAPSNHEDELFNSPRRMDEKRQICSQSLIMGPHESDNHNEMADLIDQPQTLDLPAHKSIEERRTWFRAHLVADKILELRRSRASEPEPAERALRNLLARAETGKLEKHFAEEARQVFYEENTFVVRSDILETFLEGSYGDEAGGTPVCDLVRGLTIKFTSYVEIFEFIEDSAWKRRGFAGGASLEVDADGAKDGNSPGKLRTIRVTLKILLLVVFQVIAYIFLSFVWMLQSIGHMLVGRYPETGFLDSQSQHKGSLSEKLANVKFFSASFKLHRASSGADHLHR